MCTLFSDQNGSLPRRQPRVLPPPISAYFAPTQLCAHTRSTGQSSRRHLVELCEETSRRQLLPIDGHRVAPFKVQVYVGCLVWCLLWADRPGVHVLSGLLPWILQSIPAHPNTQSEQHIYTGYFPWILQSISAHSRTGSEQHMYKWYFPWVLQSISAPESAVSEQHMYTCYFTVWGVESVVTHQTFWLASSAGCGMQQNQADDTWEAHVGSSYHHLSNGGR